MTFTTDGTNVTQTAATTDTDTSGAIGLGGVTSLGGNYQIEVAGNFIIAGTYSAIEALRAGRLRITGDCTLGTTDVDGVLRPASIVVRNQSGYNYPNQPVAVDNGGTLTLNNSYVYLENGGDLAGFGSFNRLAWTFNALNSEVINLTSKSWHYIGGGGDIENFTVRNCNCLFFQGNPNSATALKIIDSLWGVGIDNQTGITCVLKASSLPRVTIQRANNNFTLVDCKVTDWVTCRFINSSTSGFNFVRTLQTQAVGANADTSTTQYVYGTGDELLDSGALDAQGARTLEQQWGRAITSDLGESLSPGSATAKMTPAMINTNTGTYTHATGEYKLPLKVSFVSYLGTLTVQTGITFDVSTDEYLSPLGLSPNLFNDALITETTKTTVDAYATLDTAAQVYDAFKSELVDNYSAEESVIASRAGAQVDMDNGLASIMTVDATAVSVRAFNGTDTITVKSTTFTGGAITTTGQINFNNGAKPSGGTFDGDVYLNSAQSLTNVTINGDIRIATGANSTLNFNGVIVTGLVYNDSAANTLTINSDTSITAGDPGTGNGQTDIQAPVDTLTVTSNQTGSLLQVFTTGTQTVLASTTGTSLDYDHSNQTVDIVAQKAGFLPQRRVGITLSGDSTEAFTLETDFNYDASHGLVYTTDASYDRTLELLTVPSYGPSPNGVYSLMIDSFINEATLRNTPFKFTANGPNLYLTDGAEGASDANIQNMDGTGGVRYLDSSDTITAEWSGITSVGTIPGGATGEYQQIDGSTTTDARATGAIDQQVKTYGDATHGNFDYRGHLVFKFQVNGYREARADVVATYGTLSAEPYIINLAPELIDGLTLGDPAPTGLTITKETTPVSWDAGTGALDFSITVTDSGSNSGETILRWLNYNLSLDATFGGLDPFNWPEMVVDNGAAYETSRGIVEGDATPALHGVRVLQGASPHPDFTRFQGDNGSYTAPLVIDTLTVTSSETGSLIQVFTTGTQTILASITGTSLAYNHSDETVDIVVQKAGFLPQRRTGIVLSGDVTQAFTLETDFNYNAANGLTYTTDFSYNRTLEQLTVTTTTASPNDVYSALIDAFIAQTTLRNTSFKFTANGDGFYLVDGAEGVNDASIENMTGEGGVRYIDATDTVTAEWCGIVSSGVTAGLQAEYELGDGLTIVDAKNTGNVNQLIKVFGGPANGNFDHRDALQFKVQANGYRQAEVNVLDSFGITQLEPVSYVIALTTLAIDGLTLGDPVPTGLSLTDDSGAPVSWDAGDGAKNYSITVTDTGANSGDTILRWLNYNLSLDATFQGKNPFQWGELVLDNGAAYESIRGVLHGSGSDVLAGVRVIRSPSDPHPDFTRFQSDDGTYGTPPVVASLSVTNITAGSRLQIYNVTTDTELYNAVVAGTSYADTYTEGTDYTAGDTVRVRLAYQSGTSAKICYESTTVATASGWAVLAAQEDDTVYAGYGIDGSTVTGFAADYVADEVDITVAADFTAQNLYAWWVFNETTSQGIAEFCGGVTALDAANIRFNNAVVNLYLDNTTATNLKQTDNIRIYRTDEAYPVKSSGGGGIDVVWRDRVFLAETGVSGLTPTESAQLAKVDGLTFTVPGQVDANIQYVNDVQVTGDGQTGTEWGPA